MRRGLGFTLAVHPTFGTDQTPDEHAWKLKKKPKK